MPGQPTLRRALNDWQIIFLALSGIIGVTIFSTIGEILRTADVGGMLIALALVCLNAILVMESLGELIVLWPVPNALVEYVKYFVDRDLATVVGLMYWYTWSSVFGILLIAAYQSFCEFLPTQGWHVTVFIVVGIILWGLNALGIVVYGWIETIGGLFKTLNVFAGACFLWAVVAKEGSQNSDAALGENTADASNPATAIFLSMPILAYGIVGVEIVAVTAFEAKNREALRLPTRSIAWIITFIYFFVAIPSSLAVGWKDAYLQTLKPSIDTSQRRYTAPQPVPDPNGACQTYYPIVPLAMYHYGSPGAAKYFQLCIVYFCLSSANTALYVSSRTLYGLCRTDADERDMKFTWSRLLPWIFHNVRYQLGHVSSRSQVPHWALFVSALSFSWWLPLLRLRASGSTVLEVFSVAGSVGALLVWAAQCLAFIKYYYWLQDYKDTRPIYYDRKAAASFEWQKRKPLLSAGQPFVAGFGFVLCLMIALILGSSPLWRPGNQTSDYITTLIPVYAGPVFMLVIFVSLKVWRVIYNKPVQITPGGAIHRELETLSALQITPLEIPLEDGVRGEPMPRAV